MSKIFVGLITEAERDEIQSIYYKKTAVQEVLPLIDPNNIELYDKAIEDLALADQAMAEWWQRISAHYGWNYDENYGWRVDFFTKELTILKL